MITFAFDNAILINLLRKRGQCIKFEKYDAMRAINTKIDELKADPKNLEKFYRPVTAFLTLENEEGLNRAQTYNDAVHADVAFTDIRTLLGEPLLIDDAAEPTDIIWENRRFTTWERTKRAIIVCFVIAFLLFCSFVIIFSLSLKNSQITNQYPTAQCVDVEQVFATSLPAMVKSEQHAATSFDGDMTYTYTPCFCKDLFKDYSTSAADYSEM